MDRIATSIKNRLSLRAPQTESLKILADLVGKLTLQKDVDLQTELDKRSRWSSLLLTHVGVKSELILSSKPSTL